MQRRETADEAQDRDGNAVESDPATGGPSSVRYEPPRLIRVGTLRNLLGKTGTIPDKNPPFELRT